MISVKKRQVCSFLPCFSWILPTVVVKQVLFLIVSQEEEQQSKEAEQQQEDEDGWVKVTRGNKATKARPHTEAANQRTLHRELKKREKKELLNFYTWQHKNTQKERKSLVPFSHYFPSQAWIWKKNKKQCWVEQVFFFFLYRYCWTKEKVWRG